MKEGRNLIIKISITKTLRHWKKTLKTLEEGKTSMFMALEN